MILVWHNNIQQMTYFPCARHEKGLSPCRHKMLNFPPRATVNKSTTLTAHYNSTKGFKWSKKFKLKCHTNQQGPDQGSRQWPEPGLCRTQKEIPAGIRRPQERMHIGPRTRSTQTLGPFRWLGPGGTSRMRPSSRRRQSPKTHPAVFSEKTNNLRLHTLKYKKIFFDK
jgi:hypothetical protein